MFIVYVYYFYKCDFGIKRIYCEICYVIQIFQMLIQEFLYNIIGDVYEEGDKQLRGVVGGIKQFECFYYGWDWFFIGFIFFLFL